MDDDEVRVIQDWEKYYREWELESMPWYHEGLDKDFEVALGKIGIKEGRALDLGTGPGTQAMALAERGLSVTATDVSETAVEKARRAAEAKGLDIEFIRDDIMDTALKPGFDIILDRGCLHVLAPDKRAAYVETVLGLLNPGGYLLLKCFSHLETEMEGGPYRLSPENIRALFFNYFEILSIEDTVFHGTLDRLPKALFTVMLKV